MTDITDNTPQQESSPAAEPKNTEHMIPKSRLDEVLSERNELKQRLQALEEAQQKQRQTEMQEQQRFKELYEDALKQMETLKTSQETAQRYQSALQATNEARLARIPEDKRKLVPEYDDPVKLGAWLDNAEALLLEPSKPTPPKLDGGSGGGGDSKSSSTALPSNVASVVDLARQLGYEVNPERVARFARNPIDPSDTGD